MNFTYYNIKVVIFRQHFRMSSLS